MCLKLRELFDPREECSAIQVLTTHVFIRVVRVLHSFGDEVGLKWVVLVGGAAAEVGLKWVVLVGGATAEVKPEVCCAGGWGSS